MSTKRLKILVLTPNFPRWKGDFAGVFLVRLLSGLREYGIDPIVLAPHARRAAEIEMFEGIEVIRFRYAADEKETIAYTGAMQKQLGSIGGLLAFRRFLAEWTSRAQTIISEKQIDLIAGHWLVPTGLVLSRLARRNNIPMVLSSHGTDLRLASKSPQLISFLLSGMWKELEGWNTVSTFLARVAERIHLPKNGRIDVIPLPMNDHLFSPDPTVQRDRNLIVAVTKFTKQKRVDQFIRSIEIAKKSNSSLHAEIYGTGPDKESLQYLVKSLDLNNSIQLLDPVPQEKLVDIYRRAGAVVLNSVEEGFGAVLVEAMLCGTPVIGANSGGIPDIIEHGKSGLLVPPDDIPSLASAILQISSDTILADRLAIAGRERAITRFSSEVLIKQYADLIHAAAKAAQNRRNLIS